MIRGEKIIVKKDIPALFQEVYHAKDVNSKYELLQPTQIFGKVIDEIIKQLPHGKAEGTKNIPREAYKALSGKTYEEISLLQSLGVPTETYEVRT